MDRSELGVGSDEEEMANIERPYIGVGGKGLWSLDREGGGAFLMNDLKERTGRSIPRKDGAEDRDRKSSIEYSRIAKSKREKIYLADMTSRRLPDKEARERLPTWFVTITVPLEALGCEQRLSFQCTMGKGTKAV